MLSIQPPGGVRVLGSWVRFVGVVVGSWAWRIEKREEFSKKYFFDFHKKMFGLRTGGLGLLGWGVGVGVNYEGVAIARD